MEVSERILSLLKRNSEYISYSKSTESIYYYWRKISIRLSDHRTKNAKINRFFIVCKSKNNYLIIDEKLKKIHKSNERYAYLWLRHLARDERKTDNKKSDISEKKKRLLILQRKKKIEKKETENLKNCLNKLEKTLSFNKIPKDILNY